MPPTPIPVYGSGCLIEGRRILTNAHVVRTAPFIMVQKAHDSRYYSGTVEHLANDCDLALLSVNDPTFWEGVTLFELGEMPSVGDEVIVEGFPSNSTDYCCTRGIVSRTHLSEVVNSGLEITMTQIDADVNPGGSGGAVTSYGKLIGIPSQIMFNLMDYTEIVPVSTIKRFLKDIETHGEYHGIPSTPFEWQRLRNPKLADYLGATDQGVLIINSETGKLHVGDILLEVDGESIGHDGRFLDKMGLRLSLNYLVHSKLVPSQLPLKVLRDGKVLDLEIKLKDVAMPKESFDEKVPFFIYGGLIFAEASDYVYLSAVLPHPINHGYAVPSHTIVKKVNGQAISTLLELKEALDLKDPCVIKLACDALLIFDAREVLNSHQEILEWYGIENANNL